MFVSTVVAEKHKNEKHFTWTFSLCASPSDMRTRAYFKGPHEFLSPDILKISVQYSFSSFAADIFLSADGASHACNHIFDDFL